MSKQDVIFLCGEYPENYQNIVIDNNPNFVFENDPKYEGVRLFDGEQNTVIVNSFLECEHYVFGGWNFYPGKNEITYLNYLNVAIFVILIFVISAKKIKKNLWPKST